MTRTSPLSLAVLAVVPAAPAQAHGTLAGGDGFYAGLLHPVAVAEHLIALIAVGLVLGLVADRPKTGAMLAGLGLGALAGPFLPPAVAPALTVVLGLATMGMAAMAVLMRFAGPVALGTLGGIIGAGISATTEQPDLITAAGFFAALYLIVLNVAALAGWAHRWPVAPKVAAAWMIAATLLILALNP